eukprot:4820841-Prymnesium_polylepis.1
MALHGPCISNRVRLCWSSQTVERRDAGAISVRLGELPSGDWQAEIEGFKVRALRAEREGPRHTYVTEWRVHEVQHASRDDAGILVLGQGSHRPQHTKRTSSLAALGGVLARDGPEPDMIAATAWGRRRGLLDGLSTLEVSLSIVQQQVVSSQMRPGHQPSDIWLLSAAAGHAGDPGSSRAGLWGMARSARVETKLPLRCIDASPALLLSKRGSLAEAEAWVRGERCVVPRLTTHNVLDGGLVRLHFHARGAIANMFLETMAPLPTLPDHTVPYDTILKGSSIDTEVHIWVRAVGLNFRDVLNVLGEYPGDPGPPGGDTSGVVAYSGGQATHAVADAVFGIGHAPLARLARAASELLALKPSTFSFEQASTLPVTWSTAHLCMQRSYVRAGHHVTVHAAAGGVGLMAL